MRALDAGGTEYPNPRLYPSALHLPSYVQRERVPLVVTPTPLNDASGAAGTEFKLRDPRADAMVPQAHP